MKIIDFSEVKGNGVASLMVEMTESEYYGAHGRGAGRRPPVSSILEWIQQNSIIDAATPQKELSVAYAIAQNIGRYGTRNTPNQQRIQDYENAIAAAVPNTIGIAVEHQLINILSHVNT